MPSFELLYDEDEDVLEASFATYEEAFSRTIPLHDQIVLYSDLQLQHGWGLAFYGYAELLEGGEIRLDGLQGLAEENRAKALELLSSPPVSLFLEITDAPKLLATLRTPSLGEFIG